MSKHYFYPLAIAACLSLTVDAVRAKESPNQKIEYDYLQDHPLYIQNIPRTGINKKLPDIQYNIYEVFDPSQAKSIEILGIIQIQGQSKLLVKLPTSSAVNIVAVGDRLIDGAVLVKRIDGVQSSLPSVVLEEDGMEVIRNVGDNPILKQRKK